MIACDKQDEAKVRAIFVVTKNDVDLIECDQQLTSTNPTTRLKQRERLMFIRSASFDGDFPFSSSTCEQTACSKSMQGPMPVVSSFEASLPLGIDSVNATAETMRASAA